MKRFYKVVTSCAHADGGYEIHLDGQPVKTSKKNILRAPNKAVADHVVQEGLISPRKSGRMKCRSRSFCRHVVIHLPRSAQILQRR